MAQITGNLSKAPDGYKVVIERHYNHPPHKVWEAITNPEKMKRWFFEVKMDFEVGGKMTIIFDDAERTESYGEIKRIDPGKLFEWAWLNPDGPDELGTWEVFPDGEGSRLVLTYSQMSADWAAKASAGWDIILNHIGEVLDGRTEPYPFTGGQSPEELEMVAAYTEVFNKIK